jgi:UDPglucose 6-dehydrogenase
LCSVAKVKVENIRKGIIPIYESGLTRTVEENYKAGSLTFTTDVKLGIEFGDIQFIAVGTPSNEDGSEDLKYVLAVAEVIATHMDSSKIIIDKSTAPVRAADKVNKKVAEVLESLKFS